MKKYKLIKEYPGCEYMKLKIGDIVQQLEYSGSTFYNQSGFVSELCIIKDSVEHYPEFWEEVKEKEWEILEVTRNDKTKSCTDKETIKRYLKTIERGSNLHWCISKIKRLSDGEVFTIGDIIYCPSVLLGNEAKITSFELIEDRLIVKSTWHINGVDLFKVKKIEKKEPVITTEDRVHLYKGDKYWTVFLKDYQIFGKFEIEETRYSLHYKYFSTEEKAKEWVEENKPKFSQKDMIDFCLYSRMNGNPNFKALLQDWTIQMIKESEDRKIDEVFVDPKTQTELKCIEK